MADRVLGGPAWVRTVPSNEVRFDVLATLDTATDDKLAKLSNHDASLEREHMLQQLLFTAGSEFSDGRVLDGQNLSMMRDGFPAVTQVLT